MGLIADQMKAALDEMKRLDEQQQRRLERYVDSALKSLDELRDSLEAAGDPKAQAIDLLRSEGWTLIPPRDR